MVRGHRATSPDYGGARKGGRHRLSHLVTVFTVGCYLFEAAIWLFRQMHGPNEPVIRRTTISYRHLTGPDSGREGRATA